MAASVLADPVREIRVIRTIVLGSSSLRSYTLARCEESLFAQESVREILRRVIALCQTGQPVSLLEDDRALSREAREIITARSERRKPYRRKSEIRSVIEDLSKLRTRREVYHTLNKASQGLEKGETEDRLLASIEAGLVAARSQSHSDSFSVAGSGAEDNYAMPQIKSILRGKRGASILTGIPEFDTKTGGYFRGNLVIKMAQRGGGKSSQDLSEMIDMYLRHNLSVCTVNLEMSVEEFWQRVLANLTRIPHRDIARSRLTKQQRKLVALTFHLFHKHGERKGCRFVVFTPSGMVTSEQLVIMLAPQGFDAITIDHLRALQPNRSAERFASHEQYENHAKVLKKGLAENRFKPCVVKLITHMTEDWSVKYSKAVEDWADFVWAWRMSKRDRKEGVVKIQQMKVRNDEPYPFMLSHDLSVHRWSGSKDPADWSQTEDDFETDRVARGESQRLEAGIKKSGGRGKGGKSKFQPPERKENAQDDLGMEDF